MQRQAMESIFEAVRFTWQLARQILDSIGQEGESELDHISPLLCHCLYTAAEESEWLLLEQEDVSQGVWLRDFVELLQVIGRRWQVASKYVVAAIFAID